MVDSARRRAAVHVLESYRNGEYGIPYDHLLRFSAPIFELYQIDPEAELLGPVESLEDRVAVLETARLFWSFFRSGGVADFEMTEKAQELLFGSSPTPDQTAAFVVLLDRLGSEWNTMPRNVSGASGVHSFNDLVAAFEEEENLPADGIDDRPARAIDSPDALATFASPLLENPLLENQPDALSDMMARAQDYWDLALLVGEEFERQLEQVADRYSANQDDRAAIIAEANFMVARFHKLFPHWTQF